MEKWDKKDCVLPKDIPVSGFGLYIPNGDNIEIEIPDGLTVGNFYEWLDKREIK